MTNLADRCEAASGADRAIDYDIANLTGDHFRNGGKAPAYTSSIDAALTLVPVDYHTDLRGLNAAWWAMVNPTASGTTGRYAATAATPALALCAAALRAKEKTND